MSFEIEKDEKIEELKLATTKDDCLFLTGGQIKINGK